jgi:alanine dehydrogenase
MKSAAEISKGDRPVLHLAESEVMRLLDPRALLDGLEDGFKALSRGEVQSPARPELTVPERGFLLAMPAWRRGMNLTVKTVCVFEGNLRRGLPNHLALITLFDPETGAPLCVMDGTYITAIRTAASAALSVRALARKDARVATIIGAGVQGREHLKLLPLVRDFDEIRIASLDYRDAEKLASLHPASRAVENIESAVRDADVVCLASHAYEPVIEAAWIRPGTHITSVGYAPPRGELPVALARDNALYVETSTAFDAPPVGCSELAGLRRDHGIALGDMLLGRRPGRLSERQITVYKAMGIAMEDMVAADIVYTEARRSGVGQHVSL